MGQAFYDGVDKPIIVDKNRAWGTPYNLNLAALLNPDVRIITTVRPILEVLASFPAGSTYQLAACAALAPIVKSAAARATAPMVFNLDIEVDFLC